MEAKKNRKRPALAGVLSAAVWGSGQLYNRQPAKAVSLFLTQILCIICVPQCRKGLWGLITLGEEERITKGRKVIVQGDNSILLLIIGLVWLFVAITFLLIYIGQIRDAVRTAKKQNMGGEILKGRKWFRKFTQKSYPYLVLAPTAALTVMFVVVPILFGFLIAFTNYSVPNYVPPKHLVDWVGLQNFLDMFKLPMWNDTFWGVALWTIIWAVLSTLTCFFGGLMVAILINSKRVKCKKLWRTIYILPWAIPGMISLLIFRNMFNGQFGVINTFLRNQGIISANIPWLSDPFLAKIVILIVNFWLGFPYFMALMSGVMTSISMDVIEAARIDGANAKQEFRHITLPLVLYSTAPLLVMSFANNFNNFNVIYFLTDGNPINPSYKFAGSTDILITWIYKLTKDNGQYNMASVMSILVFLVIAGISTFNFLRTKSFKEEDMMG